MSLIKKTSFLALASFILLQSGFAFGFSKVDKYSFVDSEGDSVAEMDCHSLAYVDDMALMKLASGNRSFEVTVESIELKSKTMTVTVKGAEAVVLDLEKNRCNLIKEY